MRWLPHLACTRQLYTLDVASVPRSQVILPGASGDFSLTVSTTAVTPIPADVHGYWFPDAAVLAEYTFTPDLPARCLPPDLVPSPGPFPFTQIRFRTGPIAN